MKWKNKGYENDEYVSSMREVFDSFSKGITVFGAGALGTKVKKILSKLDLFGTWLDNSIDKQRVGVSGVSVISLQQYIQSDIDRVLVVAVDKKYEREVFEQIRAVQKINAKYVFYYEEFLNHILPVYLAYYRNISYVNLAQICLTERCSLKCVKCAHGCYNVSNDVADMSLKDVYRSVDAFFSKIDICGEFVLIGGEPLLYKQLPEIIEYIGEHYCQQIITFAITTNGTILPSAKTLDNCYKYDVAFEISNYSKELPWITEKQQRLIKKLKEKEIRHVLYEPDREWKDYGFEVVRRPKKEELLTSVFDRCRTQCREIRGNKFYFCVMARSVSDNLNYRIGQDDYLDLDELAGENYKKILLEFSLGYSEKGYLDMCSRCRGKEAEKYSIPAAKQRTDKRYK